MEHAQNRTARTPILYKQQNRIYNNSFTLESKVSQLYSGIVKKITKLNQLIQPGLI